MARAEKRPQHVIGDLWDCPPQVLRDEQHVREVMLAAARESGATVVDQTFHRFDGSGISGVVAVKESHLTVHTWPERGYAAVDVFLCGQPDPHEALRLGTFAEELGANVQEFTLAFPAARSINMTWRDDLAVPTHLFGRWQLPAAFAVTCPAIHDAASVDSAPRPVLPELHLVSMRFP